MSVVNTPSNCRNVVIQQVMNNSGAADMSTTSRSIAIDDAIGASNSNSEATLWGVTSSGAGGVRQQIIDQHE